MLLNATYCQPLFLKHQYNTFKLPLSDNFDVDQYYTSKFAHTSSYHTLIQTQMSRQQM